MTTDDLIAFARTLEGKTLQTRRGRPFAVSVQGNQIVYTRLGDAEGSPTRPEGHSALEKTVAQYNATQSMTTTDYQSFSVNSSYTLTLIDLYQKQKDS